jgi:hypothetical protein
MSNENINKILQSLDDMPRAEAPAFFYTRLKAKMLAQQTEVQPQKSVFWLRKPAFAFAAFAFLIVANVFVFVLNNNKEESNLPPTNDNIQAIAADYNMPDASSYYDVALEK